VDGQPPAGRGSLGRSIGQDGGRTRDHLTLAASGFGRRRAPATSDCSTSPNDVRPASRRWGGLSLLRAAEFVEYIVEIAAEWGQAWMIDPERRFTDREGLLELGAGAVQVSKGTQYGAEVVVSGSHVEVIGSEGSFTDREGLLELGAGAV
jgi:hypothetical protein